MRKIVLLRGINNIGSTNRVPMQALREALAGGGFDDVVTYLQSGNVVLSSRLSGEGLAREVERLVAERFGRTIPVVVRSRDELAAVVARDPFAKIAHNPSRYQVSFLDGELATGVVEKLEGVRLPDERFVVSGREVYAWHPTGIGRSKLAAQLSGRGLGVTATARNWRTVIRLLELAGGS